MLFQVLTCIGVQELTWFVIVRLVETWFLDSSPNALRRASIQTVRCTWLAFGCHLVAQSFRNPFLTASPWEVTIPTSEKCMLLASMYHTISGIAWLPSVHYTFPHLGKSVIYFVVYFSPFHYIGIHAFALDIVLGFTELGEWWEGETGFSPKETVVWCLKKMLCR